MLDTVLNLQNPHWDKNYRYKDLFERACLPGLLKKISLKEIQVLLGIRRSGKSSLFKLIINYLIDQTSSRSILYINLDDPVFIDLWKTPQDLYKVIETAEKLTETKIHYLFIDEIQNIDKWERFIKSVYDSELFKKIFVTGSNSSLLKSNYATLLSGRYLIERIMPLSFKEILTIENIHTSLDLTKEKAKVLRLIENILFYGSFPQIWKTTDIILKREQLVNYYDTIILKDCIANQKIRETKKLQELAFYLLNNNATLFSYNNLAHILDSNENTIREFIQVLENSFLVDEIRHFSHSLKKQNKARKKIYCLDNGLVHAVSLMFSENRGRLLENLVYSELKKLGHENIYFFNEQKECDFIIKIGKKLVALQVTYDLTIENQSREIAGLQYVMQQLPIDKSYIITFNSTEKVFEEPIHSIPFWKFFFSDFLLN